jgi:aquaporin Z
MKSHWREYATEALGLGLFMMSASGFAVLLFHPESPAAAMIPRGLARNALMGLAMSLTAAGLIYNRWGKQSGAHFNPVVTLTFYWLGKIAPRDALAYIAAQFIGGALGMGLVTFALAPWIGHREVNFVVTLPGRWGSGLAWLAEFIIAFSLMTVVLAVSNTPRFARFTGFCAAACVFLFITFESPLSGMSLNPARTLASALAAHAWAGLWIYFTAPVAGMLAAAVAFQGFRGSNSIACAKLHHQNPYRCIFCEFQAAKDAGGTVRFSQDVRLNRV